MEVFIIFTPCISCLMFQNLPQLSDEEERRVLEVICQLSDQVRKRRLEMYQYFKDYDRVRDLFFFDLCNTSS